MASFLTYILFLVFPSLAFSSTLFIGNGGEVLKMNIKGSSQYFLRDLVESNTHLAPYTHCTSFSKYADRIDSEIIKTLDLDSKKVAAKLCDIDMVTPGFSAVLIEAARLHSWTRVTETLGLLPDDGPLLSMDSERIQAANRTLLNIRIQDNIWRNLNSDNQVALFFHEIIFSLLKLECQENGCSTRLPSSRLARQITGSLYSRDTYQSVLSRNNISQLIKMSLHSTSTVDDLTTSILKMTSTFVDSSGRTIFRVEKSLQQPIEDYVNSVCQNFENYGKSTAPIYLSLMIMKQEGFELHKVSYTSPYGVEYGVKLSMKSWVRSEKSQLSDCVSSLAAKINNWIN